MQELDVEVKKEQTPTIYEGEKKMALDAVYESKAGNADFTFISGEEGIKETMLLKEKPKSNIFKYTIKLEGMFARENPLDEGITFYDKETEEITGDISAPWMNDASGDALEVKDIYTEGDADKSIYNKYEYDNQGRCVKATEAKGNYSTLSYDQKGRVKKKEYFDGSGSKTSESTYSYDMNDNLKGTCDYKVSGTERTVKRCKVTQYDKQGRLRSYAECSGLELPTEKLVYNYHWQKQI